MDRSSAITIISEIGLDMARRNNPVALPGTVLVSALSRGLF